MQIMQGMHKSVVGEWAGHRSGGASLFKNFRGVFPSQVSVQGLKAS